MKTLKQLLDGRQRPLAACSPDDSVYQALKIMADHDVGAVLVMDGESLVGILSERDYARKVILAGKSSKETLVRELMTERVVVVTLHRTIQECMALMTEKHFRHLPIVDDNGAVIGIVSNRDLVREIISDQQFIIHELERYINGQA
ncbi:MAG TPA: CBS domain-containing protein [Rhodocyclaceae bacterium]|nr:CBS domain-containing protein [Rhodocyclaceae bacterium]